MGKLLEQYKAFTAAVLDRSDAAALYVSTDFSADLGKGRLNFQQYLVEIERQRRVFSDLGRNISDEICAEGRRALYYLYVMKVCFDGDLTDGSGNTLKANRRNIYIPSTDSVTFDAMGEICAIKVETDLRHTLGQMTA